MSPLIEFDQAHLCNVPALIGVDEAGRGALAGPVAAGAVLVTKAFYEHEWCTHAGRLVNDSKLLKSQAREDFFEQMQLLREEGKLSFAVGLADVAEIATHNILGATKMAMHRACGQLLQEMAGERTPQVIVDGKPLKSFPIAHTAYVKGDSRSFCIALASIAAKVTRDRYMDSLDREYPAYGFCGHKGYGTGKHRAALLSEGPCPHHRELFLRKILGVPPARQSELF